MRTGRRHRHALALIPLLAVGCSSNAVKGSIDGTIVEVKSAMFFSEAEALGEDGLVTIILTDLKDGCQDYGYYLEATDDVEGANTFAEAWAAVFPPDFWEIAIILRVADSEVSLDGSEILGISWDETLQERNQGFASITHNKTFRDAAYFDATGPSSDYLTEYVTEGGRIEINKHLPESFIRGEFGTQVVDTENGNNKGLVRFQFNAPFCDVDIL